MTSAIDTLVKKNVRNGRNAVAAAVDVVTLAVSFGALLMVILCSLMPLPAAAAFSGAGVVIALGVRSHLARGRAQKARKRVEDALFERCFASDLLEMDQVRRGGTLAMILAASAMRVRQEHGVLLAERNGRWLPVVFICLPMEETITRRDIWGLMGRLRARGYGGALVLTAGSVSESARSFARQSEAFTVQWLGFQTLCRLAREAGFALDQNRLEQAALQELSSRPKPRRLSELIHPRHIRRIALSGLMLLLLSFITVWSLYYRLVACMLLALAAFLMIQLHYGSRAAAQDGE